MPTLKIYSPSMQPELERIFETCFAALGWEYEPHGRHADILDIEKTYMESGCMWCLFEGGKIIGASAVRTIAPGVAEMKRLYVLPEYQGKGYGRMLFETALEYAKIHGYERMRLSTRKDRSASRHLIESHGFRQILKYDDNPFAELYYELDLTKPALIKYSPSMQPELERFFETCFAALGWEYEPHGRHADILDIEKTYMESGCMWCLFEGGRIIGTSAIRTIAPGVAEMKRLYVLPEFHGKGYGRLLFETALEYTSITVVQTKTKW